MQKFTTNSKAEHQNPLHQQYPTCRLVPISGGQHRMDNSEQVQTTSVSCHLRTETTVFWKLYFFWQLDSKSVKYMYQLTGIWRVPLFLDRTANNRPTLWWPAGTNDQIYAEYISVGLRCSQQLDYIALNDSMIHEWWMMNWKRFGRNRSCSNGGKSWNLPRGTEENHETPQSG
jgi:hypothetical protein